MDKENISVKITEFREHGNELYRQQDYEGAVEVYSKGLQLDGRCIPLLVNRALAEIKLHRYTNAVRDCTEALGVDRNNVKALVRRAMAWRGKNKPQFALDDLKAAAKQSPANVEIQRMVKAVEEEIQSQNAEDAMVRQLVLEESEDVKEITKLIQETIPSLVRRCAQKGIGVSAQQNTIKQLKRGLWLLSDYLKLEKNRIIFKAMNGVQYLSGGQINMREWVGVLRCLRQGVEDNGIANQMITVFGLEILITLLKQKRKPISPISFFPLFSHTSIIHSINAINNLYIDTNFTPSFTHASNNYLTQKLNTIYTLQGQKDNEDEKDKEKELKEKEQKETQKGKGKDKDKENNKNIMEQIKKEIMNMTLLGRIAPLMLCESEKVVSANQLANAFSGRSKEGKEQDSAQQQSTTTVQNNTNSNQLMLQGTSIGNQNTNPLRPISAQMQQQQQQQLKEINSARGPLIITPLNIGKYLSQSITRTHTTQRAPISWEEDIDGGWSKEGWARGDALVNAMSALSSASLYVLPSQQQNEQNQALNSSPQQNLNPQSSLALLYDIGALEVASLALVPSHIGPGGTRVVSRYESVHPSYSNPSSYTSSQAQSQYTLQQLNQFNTLMYNVNQGYSPHLSTLVQLPNNVTCAALALMARLAAYIPAAESIPIGIIPALIHG
ncbi:MAG: hypothetical protein EZS28_014131, partial [Streblomastix strix]